MTEKIRIDSLDHLVLTVKDISMILGTLMNLGKKGEEK